MWGGGEGEIEMCLLLTADPRSVLACVSAYVSAYLNVKVVKSTLPYWTDVRKQTIVFERSHLAQAAALLVLCSRGDHFRWRLGHHSE